MLIVAIPKSASTSLLDTLGRLHGMPAKQSYPEGIKPASGIQVLDSFHSDMGELNQAIIEQWTDSHGFFKQHVPPTANNLHLLRDKKKVVLLRNPEEIVSAYWRAQQKGLHRPKPELQGLDSEKQWHSKAQKIGLYDDLKWFISEWQNAGGETLIIMTKDLIRDPSEAIRKIENFFDLPESATVKLSKKRYSGTTRLGVMVEKMGAASRRILDSVGLLKPLSRFKNTVLKNR